MKKVRFLILVVILAAVVANGSPRLFDMRTSLQCDSSNDPSLCPGGVDVACTEFCEGSSGCFGFGNVTGSCTPLGRCVCRGTPIH